MSDSKTFTRLFSPLREDEGVALVIALIALSMFSLLGLYMSFNATTELRISDNHEGEVKAIFAARAGLNHTREVLRGLSYDDLLRGPDGSYNNSSTYLAQAKTFGFRNPLSWDLARSLNIFDPTSNVSSLADDGLVNTGKYGTTNGTILIPLVGIAETVANPYGSGTVTTARYFVKVTDNNGEASELAKDAGDNPFHDGDGIIVVRSIGVSKTIQEGGSGVVRRNSVAAVEARFRQRSTFDLDAPLVVQGDTVLPSMPNMFNGNSFRLDGGAGNPGIATIDTNTSNGILPTQQIESLLDSNQRNNIQGMGMTPSITDITASVGADPDKALLLDKNYLYNFVTAVVPQFADNFFAGDQNWSGGSAPDIGSYDISKPANDPTQSPKVTLVNGNLSVSGNITGGGLLVVRGTFSGTGHFLFNGLVLVIGAGEVDMSGMNLGIYGGLYMVNVTNNAGTLTFGTPKLTVAGNSNIIIDSQAIKMGERLIPPAQQSYREITSAIDP